MLRHSPFDTVTWNCHLQNSDSWAAQWRHKTHCPGISTLWVSLLSPVEPHWQLFLSACGSWPQVRHMVHLEQSEAGNKEALCEAGGRGFLSRWLKWESALRGQLLLFRSKAPRMLQAGSFLQDKVRENKIPETWRIWCLEVIEPKSWLTLQSTSKIWLFAVKWDQVSRHQQKSSHVEMGGKNKLKRKKKG